MHLILCRRIEASTTSLAFSGACSIVVGNIDHLWARISKVLSIIGHMRTIQNVLLFGYPPDGERGHEP